MYFFMSSFDKFSLAILFAVFSLYPAFIAASVALPLMIYSSANFFCFNVNPWYITSLSQLLSVLLNSTSNIYTFQALSPKWDCILKLGMHNSLSLPTLHLALLVLCGRT